jgi:hypothetical protein
MKLDFVQRRALKFPLWRIPEDSIGESHFGVPPTVRNLGSSHEQEYLGAGH